MRKKRLAFSLPWVLVAASLAGCASRSGPTVTASPARVMAPGELQAIPSGAADHRIAYGGEPSQYGDLRVPSSAGPHPVVVLVHGGCFKAAYATLRDLAPMAEALKAAGIATWNIEYRRLGEPGSAWPGTYLDVAHAIDHLRAIAVRYALDLDRAVVLGHSAGGHLAMWAAARARVPPESAIYTANPLPLRGVVDLAGPLDLAENVESYESLCRDSVITGLMGGTPATVPHRYEQASPMKLVPLRLPQVLLWGEHENFVPKPLAEAYVSAARRAGDTVRLIEIPGAGHFETASPRSNAWRRVESVIRTLIDGRVPDN